jgi:hypothetical protein
VCNTHHPELLAPFPKWKNKFTWRKTRGVPMYCISSASERKHEIWMHLLVILSLKTLWAGVKRWRTALHRFYVYRNTYFISRDSTMCTFEVLLLCVWCLDNWSRILSGKPFNTFSMARLKTLQFFFQDLWLWYLVYSRVTLDLWLIIILIHRDLWNSQKWQILIPVNHDLDFFFINWDLWHPPPPF